MLNIIKIVLICLTKCLQEVIFQNNRTVSIFISCLYPLSFPLRRDVKNAPSPVGEGWDGGQR